MSSILDMQVILHIDYNGVVIKYFSWLINCCCSTTLTVPVTFGGDCRWFIVVGPSCLYTEEMRILLDLYTYKFLLEKTTAYSVSSWTFKTIMKVSVVGGAKHEI